MYTHKLIYTTAAVATSDKQYTVKATAARPTTD